MNDHNKELLGEIGRQLDELIFPRVRNGGIVLPSEPYVPFQSMGKEKQNAAKRQRRGSVSSYVQKRRR